MGHVGEIEQQLARHAASLTWDGLPTEARRQAVRATLWWAARRWRGPWVPSSSGYGRTALGTGGSPEATMLGTYSRVLAEYAGLVDGGLAKLGNVKTST
jgi:hypothetical protein